MRNEIGLNENTVVEYNWKFLGLFILYIGVFLGLAQIPHSLLYGSEKFTASAVADFWKMFMIPVTSSDTAVTFLGFTMNIIFECTALQYALIFLAAVLAFQGHSIRYKAIGILAGLGSIFALNILRLGILGFVGRYFGGAFRFVHLYLWQGLFAIAVLLMWVLWVNGRAGIARFAGKKALTVLAAVSISFAIIMASLHYYVLFLGFISNLIFPRLSGLLNVPASVIVKDNTLGYISGGYVIYSGIGLDSLNWVIFVGLAAMAAKRPFSSAYILRTVAGAMLMIILNLTVVFFDWSLEATGNPLVSSLLIWGIVLITILAPFLAWACATLVLRPLRRQPPSPG
ncbi:MAG: hypothetical protein M0024_14170 [Nitrospiraceae bacterium]|nr:hypothetical protein [Nitrospiraceae bacterium]